jgi:uncharacterized protein involved in outer membrane biogenesis
MPRYLHSCLLALAVALGLVAAAVLAFNIHLQSAAMQEQMRRAAIDTIGLPLNIRSSYYTPWSGIKLRGLVMPDMENAGVNFLEASEFQIVFRLFPLLERKFVVRRLCLSEAVLTWRQNSGGQWRIPRDPALAMPSTSVTPAVTPPTSETTSAASSADSAPVFSLQVENFEVRRSRVLFENRDGWPLLDAEGITARADVEPGGNARGSAMIPEAVLAGLILAQDVGAEFVLQDGLLTLSEIRGLVADGKISGTGTVATRTLGSPYDWDLQLAELNIARITLPASFSGTRLEGILNANLNLEGKNAPQRQVRGQSRVDLANGRLIPSSQWQNIGQALGIAELQSTALSEAFAELRIVDDNIFIEPLWLRSQEFAIEVRGPVTRSGSLNLEGRLLLSASAATRVTALTGRTLPSSPRLEGFREISFRITGTLENPRSDLASQLLGGGTAGRLGEFFLNLLGNP